MAVRNVYLKIEAIHGYFPVIPDSQGGRDCMRNAGHTDGRIPFDEVKARRLDALVYREYLDHHWLVPKPDKIVWADINEPSFLHRVPGAVIYAKPGDRLRVHVKNADTAPHSFHLHGLSHGIDSDGVWPFGTQSNDGRRSDEICPGQTWIYTFDIRDDMLGAWPFHDHYRDFVRSVGRGLFGGVIVLPVHDYDALPKFPLPTRLIELLEELEHHGPSAAFLTMGGDHGGVHNLPSELRNQVLLLEEFMHAPQLHLIPKPPLPLHVPIFLHRVSGKRSTPVFQSLELPPDFIAPPFTFPTVYNYHCGVQGRSMRGSITVVPGSSSNQKVLIGDNFFDPENVTIGAGSTVEWINFGSRHSVIESGGDNLPSHCFNGRCFIGNTPTIVAVSGQRIRWYVFNLDLGETGHNFHPHGQRWRFANETIDVRGLGPAESFVAETTVPPVLLLPCEIENYQESCNRPRDATLHHLRGDFLFHCSAEQHLREGLAGLVRATQTVWLTPDDAGRLQAQTGLALDRGNNDCPAIDLDRCATSVAGKWVDVPGVPNVTMMHAVLLPDKEKHRVLLWGYGLRKDKDHTRVWLLGGAHSEPSSQPPKLVTDSNIWSCAHAHMGDGKVLVNGGYVPEYTVVEGRRVPVQPLSFDTERHTFFFDPKSLAWSKGPDTNARRFYATTITLGDGRLLTLFGEDTATGDAMISLEVFYPGTGGTEPYWKLKEIPRSFEYFWYPWTFLLPSGELFIAGPRRPSRRFDWTAEPIVERPGNQWSFTIRDKDGNPIGRGENMNGTAVLLPLDSPNYEPRVLVAGAQEPLVQKTAEWIDLSAPTPGWTRLRDLNVPRNWLTSVILPDGRIFVIGGMPVGIERNDPVELFDPENPEAGWQLGPTMTKPRRYHSAAILLADGSVLVGGDTGDTANHEGESLPHERYLPSYFFKPRPQITSAPESIVYGSMFTIGTPIARSIDKVVLMRPGAVTHGFDMSQRCIRWKVEPPATGNSLQAKAPPHGNVAPPGYYLLFLVDRDRVPSTGVWIRLEKAP